MNRLKSLWKTLAAASASAGQESFEPLANFTPCAQQVLALARKEADRFHHNFVGTEHVLLGLLKLGQGVAVNVLLKLGLDLGSVRQEVEKQVGIGPDQKMWGNIPYTPRVKKVLALAQKEAKALNHTYVGTEHILLGLLREGDGVASRVLLNLGVDIEKTRQEILKELDPNFSATDIGVELSPSNTVSVQPRSELPQNEASPQPPSDTMCTARSVIRRSLSIATRFSRARKPSSPRTGRTRLLSLWSSNKPTAKPFSLPCTQSLGSASPA